MCLCGACLQRGGTRTEPSSGLVTSFPPCSMKTTLLFIERGIFGDGADEFSHEPPQDLVQRQG